MVKKKKKPNALNIEQKKERKRNLINKATLDGAILLHIISKETQNKHDIDSDYLPIREDRCSFSCKCCRTHERDIRSCIKKTGLFCVICTNTRKLNKRIKTTKIIRQTNIKSDIIEKLKKEIYAFKLQRFFINNTKCGEELIINKKKFIIKIILITRAYYRYLNNPIDKLSYEDCIKFLRPFKFIIKKQYKKFINNYQVTKKNILLPLFGSPRRRQYKNFSWSTYLSSDLSELRKTLKKNGQFKKIYTTTFKEHAEFAQKVVWIDALENELDHLGFPTIWKRYKEEHPEEGKKYMLHPDEKFSDIVDGKKQYKGFWKKMFGNPVKKYKLYKGQRVLTKKAKLEIAYNIVKNTNIEQKKNYFCMPGIYLYEFPDGKKYVGQTKGTIYDRFKGHIYSAYHNNSRGCVVLDNKIINLIRVENNNKLPEKLHEWETILLKKIKITVLQIISKDDKTDKEYFDMLNDREVYFIKHYKTYIESKCYDGRMGLNCEPGNIGTEMKKRNEENCYDHNGNLLMRGIQSIQLKDEIVGYKTRRRTPRCISIDIGKKYKFNLDKKLKIAIDFQKVDLSDLSNFEKKIEKFYHDNKLIYNPISKRKTTKSKKKIDHTGTELPIGIFYYPEKKYYIIYLRRKGVSTEYRLLFEEFDSQEEQLKTTKELFIKISKLDLNSDDLLNKTRDDLCKYIKEKNYPIFIGGQLTWYALIKKIKKYENPETKQEIIVEYEALKEWHPAPGFPEGWKRMWGRIPTKGSKKGIWKDDGHFYYKHPQNIIFTSSKPAKQYIGKKIPDFCKIVEKYNPGLSWNQIRIKLGEYIWMETQKNKSKGWSPYIKFAYEHYKKIY